MKWPELTRNNILAGAFVLFITLSVAALHAAPLGLGPLMNDNDATAEVGNTTDPGNHNATRQQTRPVNMNCSEVADRQQPRGFQYSSIAPNTSGSRILAGDIAQYMVSNSTSHAVRARLVNATGSANVTRRTVPIPRRRTCRLLERFSVPEWVSELPPSQQTGETNPATGASTASVKAYRNTSHLAAAQLDLARDLRNILTDESRSRRVATFRAAELALAERKTMFADGTRVVGVGPQLAPKLRKLQNKSPTAHQNISNSPHLVSKLRKLQYSSTTDQLTVSATPQLAAQQTKLQGASDLLTTAEQDSAAEAHSLSTTTTLTERAFKVQAARLQTDSQRVDPNDVTPPTKTLPDHDTPVAATVAILEAQNAELSDDQAAELQALNGLSASTRKELTDVLNAYLVYYRTVQDSDRTDWQRVRAAQLQLLEETADLEDTLNDSASQEPGRPTVLIEGVVSIDLSKNSTTYTEDYQLQIDAGGDDTYANNAGGANASGNATDVAALIDLDGTDTYNGRNGGGRYRVTKTSPSPPAQKQRLFLPKKGEAVGFLLDAGTGDDTYTAKTGASNGGGRRAGGFLVDAGGDDTYNGSGRATNGAGRRKGTGFLLDVGTGSDTYTAGDKGVSNGGGRGGYGFLFDVGGNDDYVGSNGNAHRPVESNYLFPFPINCVTDPRENNVREKPCRVYLFFAPYPRVPESGGLLLDGGGTDTYTGRTHGRGRKPPSNGGASYRGAGFLLDAGTGNDTYDGTNGGASRPGAAGFLLDTGGHDSYLSTHHTTNGAGRFYGVGFLMDGGTGNDTYDANTGGNHSARTWNRPGPGSLGTNGAGWGGGHGFLADGGGNDSYLGGSVGANGGAAGGGNLPGPKNPPTGFLLDAGGDDRYTAVEVAVNGGASGGIGLLYDNSGTDYYTVRRYACIDCSNIPKGGIGAQVDSGPGDENASRRTGPSEALVVDDTGGADDATCPDASYQAIQPAVDDAEPGDTVRVCAGTYPGNVTIATRNVRLEAGETGLVVLDGEHERRFGVALVGGQTTVTGFTAMDFRGAGVVAKGPATTVTETTIRNTTHGVIAVGFYLGGAAFQDVPVTTPVTEGKQPSIIANNTVVNATFGIKVGHTGNVKVASNTVTSTHHGIAIKGGKGVKLHNNTLSGQGVPSSKSQGGIISLMSGDVTMTGNTVTDFTAPAQWDATNAFRYGYGISILSRGGGEDASHTLRYNTLANNKFNLNVRSQVASTYKHFTIAPSNTVNGRPVVYLVGAVGGTIGHGGIRNMTLNSSVVPDTTLTNTQALSLVEAPGYVACVRCVNVTVRDLELAHNGHGVLFVRSRGVQVTNVTVHDALRGIGLRSSPTHASVTNNSVRETDIAIEVVHNCGGKPGGEGRFGHTFRSVTSGRFEVCRAPSVLIADNTIRQANNKFGWLAGFGGAIMATGKGITVRDNTITNVRGAGISLNGGPQFKIPGIVPFGTGPQLSPDSISPSTIIDNSITNAAVGISMYDNRESIVRGNTISETGVGVMSMFNKGLTYRNNVVRNTTIGMHVNALETDLTARNNSFRAVRWGLDVKFLYGGGPGTLDFGTSNTVNGERIIWRTGVVHRTISAADANMVVCVRCVDVTVQDMTINDNADGVVLWDNTGSIVENVTVGDSLDTGILIRGGQNNTVRDSTVINSTKPIWAAPLPVKAKRIRRDVINPFGVNLPRPNRRLSETLGMVRIVNNRIAVHNATVPATPHGRPYGYTRRVYPGLSGHYGIFLFNPTTATVTGNHVTGNAWGIFSYGREISNLRIEDNTITHPRTEVGMSRGVGNPPGPADAILGIRVQGSTTDVTDASTVIRNNTLTAGLTAPGQQGNMKGIDISVDGVPTTTVTGNIVNGYETSLVVGSRSNTTTVSIRRNRLVGAKSASVAISARTHGDVVEIHQNLLNPRRFGFGVKYNTKESGGGHMMSGGSGDSGGETETEHQQPVDATCNRWAAPSGPSSQRMPLTDPVTGEPADGRGSAVSQGHMHGVSNVHFHPWLGNSPGRTCEEQLVGTATPSPTPGPTRTPWPTASAGTGPGAGAGTGPGAGRGNGTGPGQGNDTGPGPGRGTETAGGSGTSTAPARVAATATPTATPPPTATPEIVPGFGMGVWLVAFALLVAVLAARRRNRNS